MPTYEYECRGPKCGKKFEERKAISLANAPTVCPECGSKAEKVWSVPAEAKIEGGTPKFYR